MCVGGGGGGSLGGVGVYVCCMLVSYCLFVGFFLWVAKNAVTAVCVSSGTRLAVIPLSLIHI